MTGTAARTPQAQGRRSAMSHVPDTNVWGAVRWIEAGRYEAIAFTTSRASAREAADRHPGAFVIFRGVAPRLNDWELW